MERETALWVLAVIEPEGDAEVRNPCDVSNIRKLRRPAVAREVDEAADAAPSEIAYPRALQKGRQVRSDESLQLHPPMPRV